MVALLLIACVATPPDSRFDPEIESAVAAVAAVYSVPTALVKAVIKQESGFNPRAVSKAGAVGLMQVMPANAGRLGLTRADLWIPARNILAGVRLLAALLRYYEGDVVSVLVAYNAGPRKLFAPIPRNGETPAYVRSVISHYRSYLLIEIKKNRAAGPNQADQGGRP